MTGRERQWFSHDTNKVMLKKKKKILVSLRVYLRVLYLLLREQIKSRQKTKPQMLESLTNYPGVVHQSGAKLRTGLRPQELIVTKMCQRPAQDGFFPRVVLLFLGIWEKGLGAGCLNIKCVLFFHHIITTTARYCPSKTAVPDGGLETNSHFCVYSR